MDHPIMSIERIRAMARSAFVRGIGRDQHGFDSGAPAIAEWQAEWDRCDEAFTVSLEAAAECPP